MPSLGVSSLDLGRLWQRRRPLFWFIYRWRYLPLICRLIAGACWHRARGWQDSVPRIPNPGQRGRWSSRAASESHPACFRPRPNRMSRSHRSACTWSASSRITRCLPGALLSGSENGPGPASRRGPKIAQPISAQDYTFYKGGTPADASNDVSGNLTIDRLAKSSRQSPMYFANSPTAARRPTLACGYHVRQSEFPSGDQGPSRD
jgi:hypothetical protein